MAKNKKRKSGKRKNYTPVEKKYVVKNNKNKKKAKINKPDIAHTQISDAEDVGKEKNEWKYKQRIKSILFFVFWLYFLTRLFITDFDLIFVTKHFEIGVIKYFTLRLLIFVLFSTIVWMCLKNKRFWWNILQLSYYPIYPLGFKIVKNLTWNFPNFVHKYKLNFLLFSYFDIIISFFVKFKITLLKVTGFILAIILMKFSGFYSLIISTIIFGLLQIGHIFKRLDELFGPMRIFQIKLDEGLIANPFTKDKVKSFVKKGETKEDLKKSKKQLKIKKMEHIILMDMLFKQVDEKVRSLASSKSYMKSFLVKGFYSFIFSMIMFGGINYCVFLIDANNFSYEGDPKYFEFFYYSFFTIFPDGVDIEPVTRTSKSIKMIGVFVGVFINLVIFALYLTINSERYKKNLQQVSIWSDSASNVINSYFIEKYGKEPTEALKWMTSVGSDLEKTLDEARKFFKLKK